MPIAFQKTPTSLQEKVDKLMQLTYQIKNPGDAEFARAFIIELIEKGYKSVSFTLDNQIDGYKKLQQ